uniref:Uncharacterized protein n=1 Tax=Trypanosoma vivax (strain Y486) TaxID=1055687 RepID=G0TZR8_TRYVY|nr:hypothetical protein TVY486_0807030 [Trypanosoma vivax Y486]
MNHYIFTPRISHSYASHEFEFVLTCGATPSHPPHCSSTSVQPTRRRQIYIYASIVVIGGIGGGDAFRPCFYTLMN